MPMFLGVMNEVCKEFVEVTGTVAKKTVKHAATFALLVTVMPPIFVLGCMGTAFVFACETGEKIMEVGKGIRERRRKK